jgi:hypothetical protein
VIWDIIGESMSDIFISYKKEDAGRVVRIVEALRAEGFSVWWDHGITPGSNWDRTIQEQLDKAKVVVAVWSVLSRDAPWVKEESGVGKNRGILVPIRIDDVEPPLGFGLIQAVDLIDWKGDVKDPRWGHFSGALKAVLSGQKPQGFDAPLSSRTRKTFNPMLAIVALAAALAAVMAVVLLQPRATTLAPGQPGVTAPGVTAPGPITDAEQKAWDLAQKDKTRAAFQSYLVGYPNGSYATRARDALLTCRSETREVWKETPFPSNQGVRGVGDTISEGKRTQAEACTAAKAMANKQAKINCEAIANNTGYRNPVWTVLDKDCSCEKTSDIVTVCIVDMAATCKWEAKIPEQVEICGG